MLCAGYNEGAGGAESAEVGGNDPRSTTPASSNNKGTRPLPYCVGTYVVLFKSYAKNFSV